MEVSLVVRASAQEITAMLDLLAEHGYIPQQWGREVIDPLPELEGLPPEFQLTPLEQAIVQHDLAGLRRQDISLKLDITPGTITVYRRLIRHKLPSPVGVQHSLRQQGTFLSMSLGRFPALGAGNLPREKDGEFHSAEG